MAGPRMDVTTPANIPLLDIMNTVFPVTAMVTGAVGELARPDSFGTAFCVSPGVFMTAAHVVHNAMVFGDIALAGSAGRDQAMGSVRVTDVQVWDDFDVAVLFATPQVTTLDVWLTSRLQTLSDVASFGYPHAFSYLPDDPKHPRVEVVFRAYKGYVITTRGFEQLPNRPAIYEVSSPFPPGMSGAPLLYSHGNDMAVAGIVVGCPKVHYQGMTQRVGAALVGDQILSLTVQNTGCRIGELPGIVAAELRREIPPT